MDRLTIRNSDGSVSQPTQLRWADALEKLAVYEDLDEAGLLIQLPCKPGDVVCEDLDEAGLLIQLPCKPGDTVYFAGYRNKVIEWEIESILVHRRSVVPLCVTFHVTDEGGRHDRFFLDGIGRVVFLTREEAEARLAELHETEAVDEMPVL